MRCFFLRNGHVAEVEMLTGLSDQEAIAKAQKLFFLERPGQFEAFEVWDRIRVVFRHPDPFTEKPDAGRPSPLSAGLGFPKFATPFMPRTAPALRSAHGRASGAGFAAGGAPGMAVGALSPVVGYLAKKAADRMTTGAMDRLGDLARVGGNASALHYGRSSSALATAVSSPGVSDKDWAVADPDDDKTVSKNLAPSSAPHTSRTQAMRRPKIRTL